MSDDLRVTNPDSNVKTQKISFPLINAKKGFFSRIQSHLILILFQSDEILLQPLCRNFVFFGCRNETKI